jgi:hypothetical protein
MFVFAGFQDSRMERDPCRATVGQRRIGGQVKLVPLELACDSGQSEHCRENVVMRNLQAGIFLQVSENVFMPLDI